MTRATPVATSCCRCSACVGVLALWTVLSQTVAPDLPSPCADVAGVAPLRAGAVLQGRRDEPGHRAPGLLLAGAGGQGLRCWPSLIGTPIGFLLGLSRSFHQAFDPIIQFLRPISPLAWLPLGLVIFQKSEPAAVFTIALCAMWPTVINTAVGVRSINQDYLNVGRVLKLSRWKMLTQDHRARHAALRLHRLPALARPRLARDRRRRDADRHAGRRRLPLAGVQQPRLLPHHPERRHDRRHRLRSSTG